RGERGRPGAGEGGGPVPEPGQGGRVRVDRDLAAAAVEGEGGALRQVEYARPGADHGRDPLAAGDDRAVRGRAAEGEQQRADPVGVEFGGLGGGEVGGDQYPPAGRGGGGQAEQRAQHLVADRADVRRPRRQVGVGEA